MENMKDLKAENIEDLKNTEDKKIKNMEDLKAEIREDLKNIEDKKIKNMEDLKAADNFPRNSIIYHSRDIGCIYYHYPPDPKFKPQLFPLQSSNLAGCESFWASALCFRKFQ